jgi:uncharacterized protein (DUF1330 family)
MSAFVIVDIDVTDPDRYEVYKQMAPEAVHLYGGRYIARGGAVETLEGDWAPSRLVILEFDSVEQAKAWWDSPEYRDARGIRHQSARSQMIVVEGMSPAR